MASHHYGKRAKSQVMSAGEFAVARRKLGLSLRQLAYLCSAHERTVKGWHYGARNGRPVVIPYLPALILRLALEFPEVRRRFLRETEPDQAKTKIRRGPYRIKEPS